MSSSDDDDDRNSDPMSGSDSDDDDDADNDEYEGQDEDDDEEDEEDEEEVDDDSDEQLDEDDDDDDDDLIVEDEAWDDGPQQRQGSMAKAEPGQGFAAAMSKILGSKVGANKDPVLAHTPDASAALSKEKLDFKLKSEIAKQRYESELPCVRMADCRTLNDMRAARCWATATTTRSSSTARETSSASSRVWPRKEVPRRWHAAGARCGMGMA